MRPLWRTQCYARCRFNKKLGHLKIGLGENSNSNSCLNAVAVYAMVNAAEVTEPELDLILEKKLEKIECPSSSAGRAKVS